LLRATGDCPACDLAAVADAGKTRRGPPQRTNIGQDTRVVASGQTDWAVDGAAPPNVELPGYEIVGELGRGGNGVVYKARQIGLNRFVALKMILAGVHAKPETLGRFRGEAEAVARLQNPHIVQVYDIGEYAGLPYFSLEFVDGGTLAARLERETPSPKETAHLLEIISRAVHMAHQAGVIHRDLKPGNILLTSTGEPKIADFGLAKRLDLDSGHTRTGEILGTPHYMAPEQAEGKGLPIGPAADVYSLGSILYEMLTGRPPFKADNPFVTIAQLLVKRPTPPTQIRKEVPRDLELICLKCLEKDPAERYGSALALAEDLQRFLKGKKISVHPPGLVHRAVRWCRGNPVPTGVILAVTVGGVLGFWHLSRLSDDLVRQSALEGAAYQADMLESFNDVYTKQVTNKIKEVPSTGQVRLSHKELDHEGVVPIPATMTINLGKEISRSSQNGLQVRLYSDYPFETQKERVLDQSEVEALVRLKNSTDLTFYRFEEFDGKPVLRYFRARRMTQQGCIECHNHHPDSPKTNWKIGDVRGVLEIIRPLDRENLRSRDGLRSSAALITGVSTTLLVLCIGLLLITDARAKH
jgi:serine/threonine protein kinase